MWERHSQLAQHLCFLTAQSFVQSNAAGSMWESQQVVAQDLCIFSLSILSFSNPAAFSPGDPWDSHQDLAWNLRIFSLRSPGDRVGSTLIIGRISRSLPCGRLRNWMLAFVLSMDQLLTEALINNGEVSGEAGLLVSEILQHLAAAMGAWHFFYFVAFVTD